MSGASSLEGVILVTSEKVRPTILLSEVVGPVGVIVVSLHDDGSIILAGVR